MEQIILVLECFICYCVSTGNQRYYHQSTVSDFLADSVDAILGSIVAQDPFFALQQSQLSARKEEISVLKQTLPGFNDGIIVFEYTIPRLGKRMDVVLLFNDIIFVLEFKIGASHFSKQDIDQVWDYALDLKNFHEESRRRTIVPILVAARAHDATLIEQMSACRYDDDVYVPICSNRKSLRACLLSILSQSEGGSGSNAKAWLKSRYDPTPTIIEAASHLFRNHTARDITRSDATAQQLERTTDAILGILGEAKRKKEKALCLVTGVPGAGKTLVGLRVAISQFDRNGADRSDLAVYLSGNGPLVKVLSEALVS